MDELLTTLIQVVIIPAIPILVGYLVKFLKTKANQAAVETDNELIKQYLQEATDAVLQAVTYTAQTYVDSLKGAGKFDKEAQENAFRRAKEVAIKLMTEEARRILEESCGDISTWLDTKIEQTVKEQKESSKKGS